MKHLYRNLDALIRGYWIEKSLSLGVGGTSKFLEGVAHSSLSASDSPSQSDDSLRPSSVCDFPCLQVNAY